MHTSPLAQPGTGDGGGMNVYVRQLSSALARAGVLCDVYTRSWSEKLPTTVNVEPGLVVHHVPAGPPGELAKERLGQVVEEFTDGVISHIRSQGRSGPDAIHANYWLSGLTGHVCKHELGLPLVSTFHTLDRVKAQASAEEMSTGEPQRRALAEAQIVGCSDAVLASCTVEADQLIELYGADPARIEIVPPGVDHAFFAPGNRIQARRALGLSPNAPLLLFVGRIQPLKGVDIAVEALAALEGHPDAVLAIVGGPSGPLGVQAMDQLHQLVKSNGLESRVRFVPPQPHEYLSTWYRAAEVCIVPSLSESFGLVALEAAACGTPVVASAVGGLVSLVNDGKTGFLVNGHNPRNFARRIGLILGDRQRARELSDAAFLHAAQYTWSEAARRLVDLYDRLTLEQLVDCS